MSLITLEDIRKDAGITTLVNRANDALAVLGYTDHGPSHVGFVSSAAARILWELGYPEREVEMAAIAGWVHDVGNAVNRVNHGISGAVMLLPLLLSAGMDMEEAATIVGAVGNHEEQNGTPISPVSAAVILADKCDAHRTRVRRGKYNPEDIHDRVNYSIKENWIETDREKKIITLSMVMDESSSVMDFLEIYLSRMIMCERASRLLGCSFRIVVNGFVVNTQRDPL